ncbi:myosin-M heavy chain-like [Gossypium hirsutum]|uniref:Myosin-M heavy chain-like n=1 Tax=Gossypium hirsutum TaxID=3635 RepID=A0A1U8MTM7_GOSHI|nr:myosin-M heavy chain-like [Gossypium hirsutum]
MAKMRSLVKKATKSTEEYTSSATTVRESKSPRSVAPIVQVSDNDKEEEFRDIEKYLRKIDSLFKDGIFADQEDTVVEKEVVAVEEKVAAEEKEVPKDEKEKEEEDSAVNIITTPESVGANIDNLERDGARPAEVVKEAADDAGEKTETEEKSEDRAKSKEMKRNYSNDKKRKNEEKKRRRKKHHVAISMAEDN